MSAHRLPVVVPLLALTAATRVGQVQCNALVAGLPCVRVTPDDSAVTRLGNTNGLVESFWVINDSPDADTYALSCSANPPFVTCVSVSQSSLSLNPGDSAQITITYNTGSA